MKRIHHSPRESDIDSKTGGKPSRESMMRAVALFLDGMSRAIILSFGPCLVYRLVYGGKLKLDTDCAKVAYPLAIVVAAYLLGRGVGVSLGSKTTILQPILPRFVARLSGLAIALLVFTFGAGLKSVWWLVLIRFASATIVGILCVVTKKEETTLDAEETDEERLESGLGPSLESQIQNRQGHVDFGSGTPKIYMTSFAVSILAGGLLYRHATGDEIFRDLTGSKQFTLSPLFLVGVSVLAESILRCIFAFMPSEPRRDEQKDEQTKWITQKCTTPSKSRERMGSADSEVFLQCRDRLDSANSFISPRRERSATSDSEFFDCNSVLSDIDLMLPLDEGTRGCQSLCAQYINKQCLYENGTPAFVPSGDCSEVIPENYLTLCRGNKEKAEAMWKRTQEWRRQNDVWRIHTMPNRWFSDIKRAYPHFVHGFSKKGYPIIYEQPGKMNLKELFREGCNVADMVRHYIFFLEFISNHVCTRQEIRSKLGSSPLPHNSSSWGTLVVIDCSGAGLSHLSGDVLGYLKNAGEINNCHYPLTLKRAFLVNSPFWLAGAWSSVKGILPETVQIDILSSYKYLTALREYVDDDQIPREYGGSSPYKLGEHPFEEALQDLVNEADCEGDLNAVPNLIKTNFVEWMNELSREPCEDKLSTALAQCKTPQAGSRFNARRRRGASLDRLPSSNLFLSSNDSNDDDSYDGKKVSSPGMEGDILVVVSVMYGLWNAIQGMIETAIPLWILIPPELGGLGYAPSRSGVAMFCSAVVLLWVMRTKFSRVISKIPIKAPMRSFRIGVGAQSVLLLLLSTIPKAVIPERRTDSVLVMTFTIILISCIVLSSLLGRASSTILHKIACSSFARSEPKVNTWLTSRYGMYRLESDCESGKFSNKISYMAEICGVLSVAPLCSWSLTHQRPAPFDGTCSLLLCSLVTLALYVCSFSLYLNSRGEFAPHPRDGCSDVRARKCCSFLCEVTTVLLSDMASLFEEANWSLTPLLGNSREFA